MTVSDNGIGFEADVRTKAGSFGLVGIEERIKMLDGAFAVTSILALGTTVSVSMPLSLLDNAEIPPVTHEFA
jgi:signal transduction histidine kinase